MIKTRLLLFAFLLSALTACSSGGGGDDSSDNNTEAAPTNVWNEMVWDEGTWQ